MFSSAARAAMEVAIVGNCEQRWEPPTGNAGRLDGRQPLSRTRAEHDSVTVRFMVNIARLTIWSIYCSRGGGEGRADPWIVAPFIGAAQKYCSHTALV